MFALRYKFFLLFTIFLCQNGIVLGEETNLNANGLRILKEQKCGSFANMRITNGYEVRIGSKPWMALLRLRAGTQEAFACGGTLITNRFVLTAAHCVARYEVAYVRLGEHQLSTETDCRNAGRRRRCLPPVEDVAVERIFKHPDYISGVSFNDVALIKLARTVEFKQHIKPICLPIDAELRQMAETSENFVVTGWGVTDDGNESDVLLETAIELKNRNVCHRSFLKEIKSSQICAGAVESDSCSGDSGGPLSYPATYDEMQRFVQFGVVSYGTVKCGTGYPAVYTNVASYMPWITNILAVNS